jgi:hypothetical protein
MLRGQGLLRRALPLLLAAALAQQAAARRRRVQVAGTLPAPRLAGAQRRQQAVRSRRQPSLQAGNGLLRVRLCTRPVAPAHWLKPLAC